MRTHTPALAPLLVFGAATLAVTPVLAAEVTPFGTAQLEVVEYRDSHESLDVDDYDLTDNTRGELGVEAREDLGYGRALFARYAFRVNTATGRLGRDGDGPTDNDGHEAVLGMEGGFGTLSGGHLSSPYAHTGGMSYDAFADTTLGAASNGGMTGNERPLFSGDSVYAGHHATIRRALGYRNRGERVEFWVAASRDNDKTDLDETDLDETDNRKADGEQGDLAAAVKVFGANWELFAASTTQKRATVVNDENDESHRRLLSHKVGGRYIGGNHVWSVQAEAVTSEDRGTDTGMDAAYTDDQEGTVVFAGYQYDFSPNVFVIQLGSEALEYGNADKANGTYLASGFIHRLTEESRLFTGYRHTRFEDDLGDDYTQRAFSVGLTYTF